MTGAGDEMDRLRAGLRGGAPAPDPAARAAALARAMENFDAVQGSASGARSKGVRLQGAGFLNGVRKMFDQMTTRAALGATASVAVLGVGAVLVWPGRLPVPDLRPEPARMEAPPVTVSVPAPEPVAPAIGLPPATADLPLVEPSYAALAAEEAEAARGLTRQKATTYAPAPASMPPMQGYDPAASVAVSRDRFTAFDPNPVKSVAEAPVSTFSVDVDTAAWSWLRGSLRMGMLPDPASVRIEEMVNYFPYAYPAPEGNVPFSTHVSVFDTPWNSGTHLVRIGLQGQVPTERPPLALVFLVDTSGSMQGPERLGLLKASFGMLLDSLRPEDRVAIVAYAGSAGEVLAPTPVSDRAAILDALGRLEAGGSTAGGEGLALAYRLAERMGGDGALRRVVLATDGDFNVGLSDDDALRRFVEERRAGGTMLSVLGFGRGNLNDSLMQALAQNGNGQAAYIDSAEEARKVLVDQGAGALYPIAADVKVQVEWNPATVAEYRLIGYETRGLAREDFNDDKVDAGDIGAGHQVTALYEITPVGSAARRMEPLRYQAGPVGGDAAEFGWLRLRYKAPGATDSRLIEAPIAAEVGQADVEARWAAAVAGFGQMLTGGRYLGDWGWDALLELGEGARGADTFGYRAEALGLMRTARALSGR